MSNAINVRIKNKINPESVWSTDLSDYVLLSGELALATTEDNFKLKVGNGVAAWHELPSYSNAVNISEEEYAQLVSQGKADPSIIYIVSADYVNAYGQQVKNVMPGTDLSDAATVEQLSSTIDTQKRYALVEKTLELSSGNLTCQLDDFAINTVVLSSDDYPVRFYLPPQQVNGKARDFLLRLEATTSEIPTIGFYSSGNETIDFESDDYSWMQVEPGLNLVSFTETK